MNTLLPAAESIFESFEIDASYLPTSTDEQEQYEALRRVLVQRIEELLARDTEKLMWVLYRIDVNEQKVRQALETHASLDYAGALAELIITRQVEKIKTRQQQGTSTSDWSWDM